MRKVLFLIGLLVFVLPLYAWAADVSGNWVVTMTGPQGEESFDLAITVEGKDLAITGTHPILGDLKGSGKLDGDNIAMEIASTGQMVVNFEFKGDVKDNKMSGTREIKMGGGAPPGGPPSGGGSPPAGGDKTPAGAPPGDGGNAPGGSAPGDGGPTDLSSLPDAWSAVKK